MCDYTVGVSNLPSLSMTRFPQVEKRADRVGCEEAAREEQVPAVAGLKQAAIVYVRYRGVGEEGFAPFVSGEVL